MHNRSRMCTSSLDDCYIKETLGEGEVYSWFILGNKHVCSVWRNLGRYLLEAPLWTLGCPLHLLVKWQVEFNVC